MKMNEINYCPGTLAEGFTSFSPGCLRRLFMGRKVSHVLPYDSPGHDEEVAKEFMDNRKRISISGVQEKLSLLLEKNMLRLTRKGEQGTYILKPIPRDVRVPGQVPANEHLTMQIARQVFGINAAENAMIFFKDGTPAYITKRFDVKGKGMKWGKEDFASLAGKSSDNAGPNFKYDFSYEEIGMLIQKFVPAWRIEIEKFFTVVLFNFLISNGDAHLKNFALLESSTGDYLLSPSYDLINTRIHVDDSDFALDKGLFSDGFTSDTQKKSGHVSFADFMEFGRRIGMNESRIMKLSATFLEKQPLIEALTRNSFLNEKCKRAYLFHYNTKLNSLLRN
ncbi:MAG: HipA domain-containing protein [Candidatus Marinimicrobia bacterium]|nr:HipA domain-containing protein [Candidatus Neomarinimicrobiota bacterium]MBL7138122.1 HipA domain-containing protein [Bacteroidales bacterium]